MYQLVQRAAFAAFVGLCLIGLSACNITPADAQQSGTRHLSAAEYTERYSGKSISFASRNGGPIDMETYFGKDGHLKMVWLNEDTIGNGQWAVNRSHIVMSYVIVGMDNGTPFTGGVKNRTMYAYPYPDGTASVFTRSNSGPSLVKQPKPTPGFKNSARWTRIDRAVREAL